MASIWFLIQQIFTFAILHKSQLDISDAAHLIVLIRIFEISTQVTAFQAFDAPNYVEKLSPQKLETVIRRGVRTQFIITMTTLLFFQIAVYSGILMNYKVPASWVILISTCFVLAPGAIHCTPSLLRLNVPSIFYLKLISINLIILLISTFFAFLGNILWALIVFSFNYNFNYLAIKLKTLKVFQNV